VHGKSAALCGREASSGKIMQNPKGRAEISEILLDADAKIQKSPNI
jgi:hypothetical protein